MSLLLSSTLFASAFTAESSLASLASFSSSSCNKSGFYPSPETDFFIAFPVTLECMSSKNGVLLNKSSVSRDLNYK